MMNLIFKEDLTERQLMMVASDYEKEKKNPTVMWLLYLFFGGLGVHRFYLGDTGYAVSMLLVTLFVSWATFGVATIVWLIVELFLIQKRIKHKNEEIEHSIVRNIKILTDK